jgi:hypothetical protein
MNASTSGNKTPIGLGWFNVLFGGWLVASPFVFGFNHDPAGLCNNIAVGVAIVLLTFGGARNGLLKGLIVLLGAWLYASAFILNVPNRAYLENNLIFAFLVAASAVASETPWDSPKR